MHSHTVNRHIAHACTFNILCMEVWDILCMQVVNALLDYMHARLYNSLANHVQCRYISGLISSDFNKMCIIGSQLHQYISM